MQKLQQFLGREVDNSPLILFRIGFGFLAAAEAWGAIMTGWVRKNMVQPDFTFNFIGFDFLQSIQGQPMYAYYGVMGLAGIFIMLGLFYRQSAAVYFLLWTGCYLMQKSSYNNHYYLLMLLSGIMVLVPAHRSYALDVRFGWVKRKDTCAYVYIWFFIVNLAIVYLFASFNKINADWLRAEPIGMWFRGKANMPVLGPLLAQEWFQYFISYGGIIYDGLIIFILLNARTRKLGFFLSLFFNLFNSAVFQIGIFPYLMILWNVFFYPGEQIRSIFFKAKPSTEGSPAVFPRTATVLVVLYLVIQVLLPLRHWVIPGHVSWTEEGHRCSWRMMLRSKSGTGYFTVKERDTDRSEKVQLVDYLSPKQSRALRYHPDMIWQFAQFLEKHFEANGWQEVQVYADIRCSLNGQPYRTLVDPEADLAAVDWNYFWHNEWIVIDEEIDRPAK